MHKHKMNTKIQLLAEQAGFNTHNDPNDGHSLNDEIERLAQLLLFECTKIAIFRGDPATARAIKMHFEIDL